MNTKAQKITMVGMLCALAYVLMVVGRVPVVLFLKYDPKDVIITIGGFLFGPMTSFLISLIVSLVEMVTVSETGPIGCVMNIISSCSFAATAAIIYKKKRTMSGAVTGLICGCLTATVVMLLWNYFVTPIYMGYPREAIAEMLIPAFLPFNLLKGGLNTALTLLFYKPIVTALRRAKLIAPSTTTAGNKTKHTGIMLVAFFLLATCVLAVLVMSGVL